MTNNPTPPHIAPGQLWREVDTGRLVRIAKVGRAGPEFVYLDGGGYHAADEVDFLVWRRFEFVSEGDKP